MKLKEEKNVPAFEGTLIRSDGDMYVVRRPDGSTAVLQHNSLPSMTQQEFADEADINNIMKKFSYSQLPDIPTVISEFSQVRDFHEMANVVASARSAFERLPGAIRQRFNQDPVELAKFVEDEKNYEEALKLGLVNKRAEVKPDEVLEELKGIKKRLDTRKFKDEE